MGEFRALLALGCSLLPLLSAFLLKVNTRFASRQKSATLTVAASRVRSLIYKYRARVAQFQPTRKSAFDRALEGPWKSEEQAAAEEKERETPAAMIGHFQEDLEKGQTTTTQRSASEGERGEDTTATQRIPKAGNMALSSEKAKTRAPTHKGEPRECFSAELRRIHSDVMKEDMLMDSLTQPTGKEVKKFREVMSNRTNAEDDGISLISIEDYIKLRMRVLIDELQGRSRYLSLWHSRIQLLALFITFSTAVFGAIGWQVFIPICISLLASVESIAQSEKLQERVLAVNSGLKIIQQELFWWGSLDMNERRCDAHRRRLINAVEIAACKEDEVWGTMAQPETDEADTNDHPKQQ